MEIKLLAEVKLNPGDCVYINGEGHAILATADKARSLPLFVVSRVDESHVYVERDVQFWGDDKLLHTETLPVKANTNKSYCEYCHGVTLDDSRGNCNACGGTRCL